MDFDDFDDGPQDTGNNLDQLIFDWDHEYKRTKERRTDKTDDKTIRNEGLCYKIKRMIGYEK